MLSKFGIALQEEACINLCIPASHADFLQKQIREIDSTYCGQTARSVDVKYTFYIEYFGQIVRRLQALVEICEHPEAVVSIDFHCVNHASFLIEEALKSIRRLQQIKGEKL